jgi:hypothetical protein
VSASIDLLAATRPRLFRSLAALARPLAGAANARGRGGFAPRSLLSAVIPDLDGPLASVAFTQAAERDLAENELWELSLAWCPGEETSRFSPRRGSQGPRSSSRPWLQPFPRQEVRTAALAHRRPRVRISIS